MSRKNSVRGVVVIVVLVLAAGVAWLALRGPERGDETPVGDSGYTRKSQIEDVGGRRVPGQPDDADGDEVSDGEDDELSGDAAEPEEKSAEDIQAEEDEALVDAFDDMTDKFREIDAERDISMDDVKKFHEQFRKVPKSRREECLQRALNLIPDDNLMLLAGILMDKEEDKELIELVFNDILNREESMKEVLLKEIYKDKTHPCWADAAWILDMTKDGSASQPEGESPSEPEGEERGE